MASSMENDIQMLRAQLAAMEKTMAEQVAARCLAEKQANAMGRLRTILDTTRESLSANRYSYPMARYYDENKMDLIDALVDIMEGLTDRIALLERGTS